MTDNAVSFDRLAEAQRRADHNYKMSMAAMKGVSAVREIVAGLTGPNPEAWHRPARQWLAEMDHLLSASRPDIPAQPYR